MRLVRGTATGTCHKGGSTHWWLQLGCGRDEGANEGSWNVDMQSLHAE
jgi:hypothetical protein